MFFPMELHAQTYVWWYHLGGQCFFGPNLKYQYGKTLLFQDWSVFLYFYWIPNIWIPKITNPGNKCPLILWCIYSNKSGQTPQTLQLGWIPSILGSYHQYQRRPSEIIERGRIHQNKGIIIVLSSSPLNQVKWWRICKCVLYTSMYCVLFQVPSTSHNTTSSCNSN
jgi:hypothetical protein